MKRYAFLVAAALLAGTVQASAQAPSPEVPSAGVPTPEARTPGVEAPRSEAPGSEAPGSEASRSEAPVAEAPRSEVPASPAPATGAPSDPEVPDPAAEAAPSTRKTPDALVDQSVRDLSKGEVAAAVHDDVKALRRGPLLIHGNYCGIGNRPGTPPVDLLDAACMHHDTCTHTGKLPNCACDNRLHDEAFAIARDPRTPAALKILATTVAASMVVLVCK